MDRGEACGPFGAACRSTGDGLCYRLCATSDDCPDPCAKACSGIAFFAGSDTPAGTAPVCQAAESVRFPPPCESALRTCWNDCKSAGLTPSCAIDCWKDARDCGYQVCHPTYMACVQKCAMTLTGDAALTECYGGAHEEVK
jgi:hypothetical protein